MHHAATPRQYPMPGKHPTGTGIEAILCVHRVGLYASHIARYGYYNGFIWLYIVIYYHNLAVYGDQQGFFSKANSHDDQQGTIIESI